MSKTSIGSELWAQREGSVRSIQGERDECRDTDDNHREGAALSSEQGVWVVCHPWTEIDRSMHGVDANKIYYNKPSYNYMYTADYSPDKESMQRLHDNLKNNPGLSQSFRDSIEIHFVCTGEWSNAWLQPGRALPDSVIKRINTA